MLGVVAFQGPPSARHSLSKDESLLLLILRLLFEEKAGDISSTAAHRAGSRI